MIIKTKLPTILLMLFAIVLVRYQAADAANLEDAQGLLIAGDYVGAAEIAATLESSPGFALAAQALAIQGYEFAPDDEKQDIFIRAMGYAEQAIALDPNNSEAHLQASHAMGRYAQTIGVLEALNEGYAERIREALDQALALDPAKTDAYISLGAWNAEIVKSAGFMAGILYGASEEDALAAYAKALELGAELNHVHLEYAFGLKNLDEDEYRDEIINQAQKAISLPAETAFAQLTREKATSFLARMTAE